MLHAFAGGARAFARSALSLSISSMKTMPMLSACDVALGFVDQPLQNRLDFFVDVLGLRERRGIGGHKGHAEDFRERSHNRVLPVPRA